MGVLFARIDDDLEEKFRIRVVKKYGSERGAISKAVEEAIRLWLSSEF